MIPQDHRSLCKKQQRPLTKTTTSTHAQTNQSARRYNTPVLHSYATPWFKTLILLLCNRMWHLGSRRKQWPQGPSNKGSQWRCFSSPLSDPAERSRQSQLQRAIRATTVEKVSYSQDWRLSSLSSLLFLHMINHSWSTLLLWHFFSNRHSMYLCSVITSLYSQHTNTYNIWYLLNFNSYFCLSSHEFIEILRIWYLISFFTDLRKSKKTHGKPVLPLT